MDGPLKTADCGAEGECNNFTCCPVNWLWAGLEKICDEYLEKITVYDLLNDSSKKFLI